MLLPLQGALFDMTFIPRAMPWAMALLGFQPVAEVSGLRHG